MHGTIVPIRICTNWHSHSYTCICLHMLSSSDTNECSFENGGCFEICINTEGSFYCGCNGGLVLDDDGATCIGMYTNIFIYVCTYK